MITFSAAQKTFYYYTIRINTDHAKILLGQSTMVKQCDSPDHQSVFPGAGQLAIRSKKRLGLLLFSFMC